MQKSCEQEKKKSFPRCPIIVFPSVHPILSGYFVCMRALGLYPRQHWSDIFPLSLLLDGQTLAKMFWLRHCNPPETAALLRRKANFQFDCPICFLIIETDCFLPLRMSPCVQSGELFAIGVCAHIR